MRIGIYGGSFNPPHNMHLYIANELINKNYVDKVIFVPTGNKYNKDNLIDAKERLQMLKIMINNFPNMYVSSYEFKDSQVHTYQTLDYFKNKFLNDEIYFICGIDNLNYINEWAKGYYILENYKILVIGRDNMKSQINSKNVLITNISENNISSSFIREKIKNNESVEDYIDTNVLKYIKERNLYERGC